MGKIATVHGGHGLTNCVGAIGYINESEENRKVSTAVQKYLSDYGVSCYECTFDSGNSASDILKQIVSKCNSFYRDIDISIHFNACQQSESDGKNKGVECYIYSDTSKAKKTALAICENISCLGFTNRGVKANKNLYFLKHTNKPSVLVEVCFCDDADDVKLYNEIGVDKIAESIARAVKETI